MTGHSTNKLHGTPPSEITAVRSPPSPSPPPPSSSTPFSTSTSTPFFISISTVHLHPFSTSTSLPHNAHSLHHHHREPAIRKKKNSHGVERSQSVSRPQPPHPRRTAVSVTNSKGVNETGKKLSLSLSVAIEARSWRRIGPVKNLGYSPAGL